MNRLREHLAQSPALARVGPFFLFLVLTSAQGQLGAGSAYWLYLVKTLVGAWAIWCVRPLVPEMRWAISPAAVLTGVGVFVLWAGLEPFTPRLGKPGAEWNPHAHFGADSALAGLMVLVRVAGSTLVVPPLEEVFYRSFLYRYLSKVEFQAVPLGAFAATPFVATSLVFGLVHPQQWLAAILCGAAYQGLVCWRKRLGDAMTAHAITNALLGAWVINQGAWRFW